MDTPLDPRSLEVARQTFALTKPWLDGHNDEAAIQMIALGIEHFAITASQGTTERAARWLHNHGDCDCDAPVANHIGKARAFFAYLARP
jgi:hypothetical protein